MLPTVARLGHAVAVAFLLLQSWSTRGARSDEALQKRSNQALFRILQALADGRMPDREDIQLQQARSS